MRAQRYDAAEFLETTEDCVASLNAALEDGDSALVSAAMGDMVRTCGMAELAQEKGMGHGKATRRCPLRTVPLSPRC